MFLFVWTNFWMHIFELVISSICVLVLGGWYGTGGRWEFILTENEPIIRVKKKKQNSLLTWCQVHKPGDYYTKMG